MNTMLGWLKKRTHNGVQRGSSFVDSDELTVIGCYESRDGAVKMPGGFKDAQEAQQRGGRGFLRIHKGPDIGTTFCLVNSPAKIGRRDTGSEFGLKDGSASRNQCGQRPAGSTFKLIHCGSKNGTFLDAQPAPEKDLLNGGRIAIGSTLI